LSRWLFGKAVHREKERKRNGEVLFYGKVVDLEDRPLAGVAVSATALQYPLTYMEFIQQEGNSRDIPIEVVTDSDGRFEISGIRAMSIGFSNRSKEGYEIDGRITPENLSFIFIEDYPIRYKADFSNPVIFRMKKVE